MKFYIQKIVLWLNNGKRRDIEFLPNKVNVITGDSSTGKTEILDIIDY
jgi:predicted ATP-binding protein involved in virulence